MGGGAYISRLQVLIVCVRGVCVCLVGTGACNQLVGSHGAARYHGSLGPVRRPLPPPPSPSSVPESLRYIQVQLQGPRPSLIIIVGSRSSLSHRLKFWTFCSLSVCRNLSAGGPNLFHNVPITVFNSPGEGGGIVPKAPPCIRLCIS